MWPRLSAFADMSFKHARSQVLNRYVNELVVAVAWNLSGPARLPDRFTLTGKNLA